MRNLIIIFLCAFAFTANAQSIEKIRIEDNLSIDKQYFPVSYNGKKLLSNQALPKIKKRKGSYNSILLQDLVNEIKKQVRTEISDSIATVGGGGGDSVIVLFCAQQSTNPPDDTEIKNSFTGDTLTWTHEDTGEFSAVIDGITIEADEWFVEAFPAFASGALGIRLIAGVTNNTFRVHTYNTNGNATNNVDFYLRLTKY